MGVNMRKACEFINPEAFTGVKDYHGSGFTAKERIERKAVFVPLRKQDYAEPRKEIRREWMTRREAFSLYSMRSFVVK